MKIYDNNLNQIDNTLNKCRLIIESYDIYEQNSIKNMFDLIVEIRNLLIELRAYIANYTFKNLDDEIRFFKIQKPEILSKLLFFNQI